MTQIKLLLVEDQNPELFKDILAQYNGFNVTIARDGNQALLHAFEEKFDVIVVDLRIPFQDGLQVIEQIRSGNGPNTNIPILAMSAYTDAKTRGKVKGAGGNGYLAKPVNYLTLYKKILKLAISHPRTDVEMQAETQAMQRRLNELRLKKAQYGLDAPVHILTEIQDLEKELEQRRYD